MKLYKLGNNRVTQTPSEFLLKFFTKKLPFPAPSALIYTSYGEGKQLETKANKLPIF